MNKHYTSETARVGWWIHLWFQVEHILKLITLKWGEKKSCEKSWIGEADVRIRRLADEVGDLLGELMGAADHHTVQRSRVLGNVDHDGPHFEDSSVVGLQTPLGAVQGLRLGDVAFDHRSVNTEEAGISSGAKKNSIIEKT